MNLCVAFARTLATRNPWQVCAVKELPCYKVQRKS